MDLLKTYNNRKIISQSNIDLINVRMTNGYGIAHNYACRNECPKCQAKIVKTGEHTGCYDGEWTWTDKFTCKNDCYITFKEMKDYNCHK